MARSTTLPTRRCPRPMLLGLATGLALLGWVGSTVAAPPSVGRTLRPAQVLPGVLPAQSGDSLFMPVDLERDRPGALRQERDRMLAGITMDKLLAGLQAPRKLDAKALATRRDLVGYLIAYYRHQVEADATATSARQQLAFMHLVAGDTFEQLGESARAIAAFRSAAEQYALIMGPVGQAVQDPGLRRYEAYVWHRLGAAYQQVGQNEAAQAAYGRAVQMRQELARAAPRQASLRFELATTQMNLGLLLEQTQAAEAAEAADRAAVELLTQLAVEDPRNVDYRQELARSLRNLGRLRHKQGQKPLAQADFQRAVALQEELIQEAPREPNHRRDLALSHFLLSVMHQQNGRRTAAPRVCRAALEHQRQLVDDFPNEPEYQQEYARTWHALGVVEQEGQAYRDALSAFQQALTLQENLVRLVPDRPVHRLDLSATHHSLAVLHHREGRRREAKAAYDRARSLQEQLIRESSEHLAIWLPFGYTLHNLGIWYAQEADRAQAAALYRQALEIRRRVLERTAQAAAREALACTQVCFAATLRDESDWQAALETFQEAIATLESLRTNGQGGGDLRWWLRNAYWGRAVLHDRQGQFAEALKDWDQAIAMQQRMDDDPGHELAMLRLFRMASAVADGSDPAAALSAARGLSIAQRSQWGPNFAAALVLARVAARTPANAPALSQEAVAALRRARQAGYFQTKAQANQFTIDPAWKALMTREDFQAYVRTLAP